MRRFAGREWAAVALVIVIAASAIGLAPPALAQSSVDLNSAAVMRQALDVQLHRRVKVKLISGQELEGQVSQLGTQAVLLTDLTGMEYYEATILIDQIAAVIVRARGR